MSLIKLEIAKDYPIGWNFEKVLRDFLQNFYDSLPYNEFKEKFLYSYELENGKYKLIMETHNTEFNYEWLIYVGGSTKTKQTCNYIGKFGEGFKMSALRIMQMGGMTLTMHSKDWKISPTTYIEKIDNKEITMFGYDYEEVDNNLCTRLEISGISEKYENELKEGLKNFFYPENELFGKRIGKGDNWEAYEKSSIEIPCKQKDANFKGILFINGLARGRLDMPIMVNYKVDLDGDSRSRETFTIYDNMIQFHNLLKIINGTASLYILELIKNNWNTYPNSKYDIESKYYVVCQLVRNIAKDKIVLAEFKKKYKDLVYIERKSDDPVRNKNINEIQAWAKVNNENRIVNPVFRLIGAKSLKDEYEIAKKCNYRPLNKKEFKRAYILYLAVTNIIPITLTNKIPKYVIDESKAIMNPLQYAERNYSKKKGQKNKKYEIKKLVFIHEDFDDEAFYNSMIKMAVALLHVYGDSRSKTVTGLLTYLGSWIIENEELIFNALTEWQGVK